MSAAPRVRPSALGGLLLLLAAMVLTGLEFGMLGVIFGMWAKGFESLTFITTFIMLAGIAKPMPMLPPERDRIWLLMPISSPRRLISAPPELPGLIEASVWMKSS